MQDLISKYNISTLLQSHSHVLLISIEQLVQLGKPNKLFLKPIIIKQVHEHRLHVHEAERLRKNPFCQCSVANSLGMLICK